MWLFRVALAVVVTGVPAGVLAEKDSNGATEDTIILSVDGLDPHMFAGGKIDYDTATLRALGEEQFSTTTIWTDGVHVYTGVMLNTLIGHLNIHDAVLRFHALNDYTIEFPTSEVSDIGPILAYEVDGAAISVRDKGPVWMIFPFDDHVEFRNDITYSRSIWQLDRIEVVR